MGFRNGAYAKVWEVKPKSELVTVIRISTSHKVKGTDDYEQDFSGFCSCLGTSAASQAAKFNEGDRIKLGDVEVSTSYDKAKNVTYTNYKIYSFGEVENKTEPNPFKDPNIMEVPEVDGGDLEEEGLPF